LIAAREAMGQAQWGDAICRDPETALIVGTSKGPVEEWLADCERSTDSIAVGVGQIGSTLAQNLGFGIGPRSTISAACASGLHALLSATLMIQSGAARRVLVVGVEASVHPLFIGSFARLGVVAPPGDFCRPFDVNRKGFLMSEAAAAVCLEARDSDGRNIKIDRVALGGDAVHLTAGDPSGRTIRRLLGRVVDGRPVDLVHAHGTGTEINDATELAAIESVLVGESALYSHKGALGHSLGASGLVSVVLNCLCHEKGVVLPNINTVNPLPSRRVRIECTPINRKIQRSIVLASGFGGPAAAVSLISI
jgi:3-oxoacyl-[acyl-carrier-protein] synthase II